MQEKKKKEEENSLQAIICLLTAILAKTKNQRAGGVQKLLGLYLVANGEKVECLETLNHLKLTPSYSTMQRLLENEAKEIDERTPQKLQTGEYVYVVDNINKFMSRRHYTIELEGKMFNGTMRVAIKRRDPASVPEIFPFNGTYFPDGECNSRLKTGTSERFERILRHYFSLKKMPIKKPCNFPPAEAIVLKISEKDSKETSEMIEIAEDLILEGNLRKPTR